MGIRLLANKVKSGTVCVMTLEQWRLKKGFSKSQLARKLGASHAKDVTRWCIRPGSPGAVIPGRTYMDKIIALTDGEVMPNDFYCRDRG